MLDPKLKRGLLEVCVLSTLVKDESYGYKIIRDLSDCVSISESTLYPILRNAGVYLIHVIINGLIHGLDPTRHVDLPL